MASARTLTAGAPAVNGTQSGLAHLGGTETGTRDGNWGRKLGREGTETGTRGDGNWDASSFGTETGTRVVLALR